MLGCSRLACCSWYRPSTSKTISRNSTERLYLEYAHLGTRLFCLEVGYCTQLTLSVRFTLHLVVPLCPVPEARRASTAGVEPPIGQQPPEACHKARPRGEILCVVEIAADRAPSRNTVREPHAQSMCADRSTIEANLLDCQFNVEVMPDLSVAASLAPSVCTPTIVTLSTYLPFAADLTMKRMKVSFCLVAGTIPHDYAREVCYETYVD